MAMILTTTPTVDGRTITEYKGVVFGENNGMLMVTASGTAVKLG